MVSFQKMLVQGLAGRGIETCFHLQEKPYAAVLVIGGSRDLAGLWRARKEGILLVQRLDGMNWLHRKRKTGLRHFLRAEYGNWLLALIRSRLAQRIVYQSQFSKHWWERVHGPAPVGDIVVYNGVDINVYIPEGPQNRPEDCYRLLMVEGSLGGGYEMGLETAVQLAERLNRVESQLDKPVELVIAGRAAASLQAFWSARASFPLHFLGLVPHESIPQIDRSSHLLYSADLNAACPNSVIEALACGLPVAAFDTGALPEILRAGSGRVAAYGADPWKLDPPDVDALAQAAAEILKDQQSYREAARKRAEQAFRLDRMVDQYVQVLLDGVV